MMEVEIKKEIVEEILKLCRFDLIFSGDEDKIVSGSVEEVCGVLIGELKENKIVVEKVRKAENIAKSPFLFEISPHDLYNAYIDAQKEGKEVVGVFHSHPHGSPNPSPLDIKGIKGTGLLWLIVGRELKAFSYDNKLNKIIELKIKIE
ncbi:metalloprotease [Archaeoglobales archaeon]|nr:MAG: metalloprotease [Archaeoglobales archaeon]